MVSALIMPRSATTQIRPIAKRRRSRSITGIRVVTSASVARPHLGAHWPSVAVDQDREDHLAEVRAMVLAVAVAADGLAAHALEVETGGVHEHQVEPAEQIAPMGEQALLDQSPWCSAVRTACAPSCCSRRQFLAEPGHRPIEMMQLRASSTPAIR